VRLDVAEFENGLYTIRLLNAGQQNNFKVLVSK